LNLISHYIFVEKLKSKNGLDSIPDPTDPSPGFKYTSGNAILMGSEIYLDLHPHPLDWLHLENSFSFVQASQHGQSDSTKYLPFIPAPKYRGEVKVQFKKVPAVLSNAYFKLSLDQYFSQTRVFSAYGTETATPSYTLLSASIGSNIKVHKKADAMSIFITGDNLTNVAYQSHLSRLKYAAENMLTGRTGVFNMGRSISVKMIFKF
jgi:iron complex outermembrane receptor protein